MAGLRGAVKWLLFLSSYIPLYIILIFKHRDITLTIPQIDTPLLSSFAGYVVPVISLGWFLIGVVSALILYAVFNLRVSKGAEDFKRVESYRSRDDLITNYILVYIFPFVVLDYSNFVDWFAFVIFFLVIGIVQVKSNHLYVNPVLALFDYRIYEVDTGDRILTLVSKGEIEQSVESLRAVELSNDVYLTT